MKTSCAIVLCVVLCLGFFVEGRASHSVPSETIATQASTAQAGLTRANRPVDYGTWVSSRFRIEAPDAFERLESYSEEEADEGEALARIAYPYEWPARYLCGALPEYKGQGWIADLRLIYPCLSTEAECVRGLGWTMYEYKPEELEAFLLTLREAGYTDSTDEELLMQVQKAYASVSTSYGLLVKEGVQFHYYTAQNGPMMHGVMADFTFPEDIGEFQLEAFNSIKNEDSGDYVHFSVDFLDPKEPDFNPAKESQLEFMKDVTPDEVIYDEEYEEGIRVVVYGAPSAWPKKSLGNLVPEYTLPGTLSNIQITSSNDNAKGQKMLMGTVYIEDAPKTAFEDYAKQLLAHGYRRVAPEQYHERDTAVEQNMKACAVFFYPGLRCYLAVDDQTGKDMLVISLQHDGRITAFFN